MGHSTYVFKFQPVPSIQILLFPQKNKLLFILVFAGAWHASALRFTVFVCWNLALSHQVLAALFCLAVSAGWRVCGLFSFAIPISSLEPNDRWLSVILCWLVLLQKTGQSLAVIMDFACGIARLCRGIVCSWSRWCYWWLSLCSNDRSCVCVNACSYVCINVRVGNYIKPCSCVYK